MLMKTHQPTEFPHTVIILSVFQQVLSSLTGITRSCRNFQSTEGQTADKASLLEAHPPPLSQKMKTIVQQTVNSAGTNHKNTVISIYLQHNVP